MSIIVTDRKFYNQRVNGADFSLNTSTYDTYLKCNVNELIKAVITVRYSWSSTASLGGEFTIVNNVVTRVNGSFLVDGFVSGDVIDVSDATTSFSATTRTITSVSDTVLIYDGSTASNASSSTTVIKGKTALRGFRFNYNIVQNTAPASWSNLQDGASMSWLTDNVGTGAIGSRSTTPVNGTWSANPFTGKTGSFNIAFSSQIDTYTQEFVFTHVFKVYPFVIDSEKANFEGGQNISYLTGGNSYKYIFMLAGGATPFNPNEKKIALDSSLLGNVGGFEMNFSGNPPKFAIDSIAYTDNASSASVSALQADKKTDVEIIITSPTGIDLDANHVGIVQLSRIPSPSSINILNDFDTNWFAESLRSTRGAVSIDGTRITNLLITNGSPASTYLKINFSVEFESSEKLQLSSGDDYMIAVNLDNINNLGNDATNVHVVSQLLKNSDVTGLFEVNSVEYFRFDQSKSSTEGFTNVEGWLEDEFCQHVNFDITYSDAYMKALRMKMVAFNTITGSYFVLDSISYNFSNPQFISGKQIISINQDRAFNLPAGNLFKNISLTMGTDSAGKQYYDLYTPFKMMWADYLPLQGVDTVFYNAMLLNDGQNQKINRYSGFENYVVKILMEADMVDYATNSTTTYVSRFPAINIYDYSQDVISEFSSYTLEVLTISGLPMPNGKISKTEDTLIRVTFVFNTPIDATTPMVCQIHFEPYQNGGLSINAVINNIDNTPSGQLLQPKIGFTKLDVVNNGTNVVAECIIKASDAALLPSGAAYHFTPRLVEQISYLESVKITEDGIVKITEDGQIKIIE